MQIILQKSDIYDSMAFSTGGVFHITSMQTLNISNAKFKYNYSPGSSIMYQNGPGSTQILRSEFEEAVQYSSINVR